jgi:hypothetical protein
VVLERAQVVQREGSVDEHQGLAEATPENRRETDLANRVVLIKAGGFQRLHLAMCAISHANCTRCG